MFGPGIWATPAPAPAESPPAASAARPQPTAQPSPQRPAVVWSQEPTLVAMRREINDLRGLLEHQLAGLAWGAEVRRHPLRTRLLRSLVEAGFSPRLCMETAQRIPDTNDFAWARRMALGLLAHRLQVTNDDIATAGGIVALVGPTGVGKTTTIAKLAARHALLHGANRVALVTADNYRVGAHEQLRTYARLLDVPLRIARDHRELQAVLQSLDSRSLVLVDTAGMSQRAGELRQQLAMLRSGVKRIHCYLVASAAADSAALEETAMAFGSARLTGCILTKLDEAASLGGVLSTLIQHRLPVAYVSDGQRVPEDLAVARAHSLISRGVIINRQHSKRVGATAAACAREDLTRQVEMAANFGRLSSSVHV